MKPSHVITHMLTFALLVCTTLIGLSGAEQNGGGYLWELLVVGSPLLIGVQITRIITSGE